jgi:hypothetical protein
MELTLFWLMQKSAINKTVSTDVFVSLTSTDCDPPDADAMITFAKGQGVNNKQALIDNAIAYRQHPRNALNTNGITPSTPFCQNEPKNSELKGKVNAQLAGVNPGIFSQPGGTTVAFGDGKLLYILIYLNTPLI